MNINHRITRLEEHTPTGGCDWCAGRMVWLLEDLPEERRERTQPVCPYCGTRQENVKFVSVSRDIWEAL